MGAGVYGGAAWLVLEQQRKERERAEKNKRKKDEHDRAADRVDGFDRDDLGESPDY